MITQSMQRDMDMRYMQERGEIPIDLSDNLAKAERDLHECQGHIEHLEAEVKRLNEMCEKQQKES